MNPVADAKMRGGVALSQMGKCFLTEFRIVACSGVGTGCWLGQSQKRDQAFGPILCYKLSPFDV